jgi:arabinan endo-1,5-alpha-L-arabinosidase
MMKKQRQTNMRLAWYRTLASRRGGMAMRAWCCLLCVIQLCTSACRKSTDKPAVSGGTDTAVTAPPTSTGFDINSIEDTYTDIAPFTYYTKWSVYNVHDPSIRKFGDTYYCYSTDVAYGITVRPGIQVRTSTDLVEWHFQGWAFPSVPSQAAAFITQQGGTPNNALWAPFIMKAGDEYRLYYALSSATPRLSVIGLAVASSPLGPWTERGLVVHSVNDNTVQTNAIDPSVVVTPSGKEWMYYGSAFDGIYVMKLDPATGLAQTPGDVGKRVAQRGFTQGVINGNIEGPEVIYNDELKMYYLFISYDWLETKYNVRVGRSSDPQGPFYDFNHTDLNTEKDNIPMILAPYAFRDHAGWQGTGHCTVFTNDSGQYFMAHQARPVVNKYFMDLHVRKMFWNPDGWPVVSPERYAWDGNELVKKDSLTGDWERIMLNYQVVPGFQAEQTSADLQLSAALVIRGDGTLNADGSTWSYSAPWLTLHWTDGTTDEVMVQRGRDWEHKKSTVIFTGLNNQGTAVWGKKDD